jgi:hypothetical protein
MLHLALPLLGELIVGGCFDGIVCTPLSHHPGVLHFTSAQLQAGQFAPLATILRVILIADADDLGGFPEIFQ